MSAVLYLVVTNIILGVILSCLICCKFFSKFPFSNSPQFDPFATPALRNELEKLRTQQRDLQRDYGKCAHFCLHFAKTKFSTDLSNEAINQRDRQLVQLSAQLDESRANDTRLQEEKHRLATDLDAMRRQLESMEQAFAELTTKFTTSQEEKAAESEAKNILQAKVDKLEASLKSDKKYKELREKVTNLEMEVESLNVVIEMKNEKVRALESEKMQTEVELQAYDRLRETYQKLVHEKEALTETVALKARKNAEQSRELDGLRNDLRREFTARKQFATKADQLEYQLNQTREQLSILETSVDASQFFTPCDQSVFRTGGSKSVTTGHGRPRTARRLFSTPCVGSSAFAEVSSSTNNVAERQHYQHQEPAGGGDPMHEAMLKMQTGGSVVVGQVSSSSSSSSPIGINEFSPIANDHHHNLYHLSHSKFADDIGQHGDEGGAGGVSGDDQTNIEADSQLVP